MLLCSDLSLDQEAHQQLQVAMDGISKLIVKSKDLVANLETADDEGKVALVVNISRTFVQGPNEVARAPRQRAVTAL